MRRILPLTLLAAVLVSALGGFLSCSSMPFTDADWRSGAGTRVLHLRWVKSLAPEYPNFFVPEMLEEHDRFNPVETTSAGFDTDKRRAFVGAAVGGLYCLDLQRGETVWRFELDDPVGSTPRYDAARKRVYFGADDGVLYGVHARSGRLLWSTDTGGEVKREIVLADDTLYLANADNTILAVDPEGGEVIWRFRRPPMEGFSAAGYADILLYEQNVIAAFSDGTVSALDRISGAEIWSADLAREIVTATQGGEVNLVDADATPVLVDGVVGAASVGGGLYGLSAYNGNVMWTRPDLDRVTGLAAANGAIYAARASKGITAVDPRTGRTLWRSEFGEGILLDPVIHDDLIIVSDSEAGLFVVSNAKGVVLQRLDPKRGFFARPSVHGGYLLVMGNRSTLYALSIS